MAQRPPKFRLKFDLTDVPLWSERYEYAKDESEIETVIAPAVRKRGYVKRDEFLAICKWKSERTKSRCARNTDGVIRDVTGLALTTCEEQLRIESLTLLNGVAWPTASVLLHFLHRDRYPILDYRALYSLSADVPHDYGFPFWWAYVERCRELAGKARCSMRELDRALWQYSKERQG